jgi:hypothetical protein
MSTDLFVTIEGWIGTGLGLGVPYDHSAENAREHLTSVDERRDGKRRKSWEGRMTRGEGHEQAQ